MPRFASPAGDEETVDPSAQTIASDAPPPRAATPVKAGAIAPLSPAHVVDPLVGKTLRHFRIDGLLGKGGMGAVYRAFDVSLHRPVALKVLLRDTPAARARFVREARAQAKLRHPNVVPIHYVDDAEVTPFFVMEIVEGESLAALLERGALAPERALDIIDVVAQALEAGHDEGLVHRDVKPSNILIERGGRVLLADFGLAKEVHENDPEIEGAETVPATAMTRVGSIMGTPAYLAPEQAAGLPVDFRADIYALGVTLYESVTGQPPFTAPTTSGLLEQQKTHEALSPRMLVPTLNPKLEALIQRMMQKNPTHRFATYPELRSAIALSRTKQAFPAPPVPRGIAFALDLFLFGVVALPSIAISAMLFWPTLGLLMGVAEGRWGRTLGKKWMRLCAVGPFDTPIGYGTAIVRNEVKLWGPILATVLERVHLPAHLSSLAWLVMVTWVVDVFIGAFGRSRRAIHDRLAGARVVVALEEASLPVLRGLR